VCRGACASSVRPFDPTARRDQPCCRGRRSRPCSGSCSARKVTAESESDRSERGARDGLPMVLLRTAARWRSRSSPAVTFRRATWRSRTCLPTRPGRAPSRALASTSTASRLPRWTPAVVTESRARALAETVIGSVFRVIACGIASRGRIALPRLFSFGRNSPASVLLPVLDVLNPLPPLCPLALRISRSDAPLRQTSGALLRSSLARQGISYVVYVKSSSVYQKNVRRLARVSLSCCTTSSSGHRRLRDLSTFHFR